MGTIFLCQLRGSSNRSMRAGTDKACRIASAAEFLLMVVLFAPTDIKSADSRSDKSYTAMRETAQVASMDFGPDKVLVVEAEPGLREHVATILTEAGYQVSA